MDSLPQRAVPEMWSTCRSRRQSHRFSQTSSKGLKAAAGAGLAVAAEGLAASEEVNPNSILILFIEPEANAPSALACRAL